MAKYRNISDNNSISLTNLPFPSSSTPLLPNSLVGVSEAVVFDYGSSSLAEDIPSTSNSTALSKNTPIDVSESEDRELRNTSFDNKRICFFCGRDRKQIKGKQQSLHSSNEAKVLSDSLSSDAIYYVSNGTVKPSKHITLGMTVKSLTSSRKMINNLNRLGHCCNYNTLEELETKATISSVNRSQICFPDILQSLSLSTGVAFDNFDRYVDTLTGKDTLQDTVGIIS
ncbi:hypothetical protein TNIN_30281 [Trichonephila inaurata madagascariensis]|uniref:Uncharacterized protein n=1 Tax=Trichonephila inaurata madagascariensis TaxID=2747483 RepID=A0A8X6MB60_9ARAC|nr:hypothetical protein TNIN_67451 [Trichonephila inaurata madagascariensis]GFY49547.1 hypothetical protein TNIN_30281 [Trichonephila inaurata madagascariensis]